MGKQYSEERQPLVSTRQGQSLVEVAPSPPAATRPSKAPRRTLAAIAVVAAVAIVAAMALTSNSVPALGTSQLTGKGDFDEHGRYRMKDFDTAKPMSNFLPGIGGLWGVPMWAFYVNRGQGIASFGMQNKDGPIMKFDTANLAYSTTPTNGFRTMLKVTRPSAKDSTAVPALMQPFMPKSTAQCLPGAAPMPQRDMYIGANEMEVREADETNGISTSATYVCLCLRLRLHCCCRSHRRAHTLTPPPFPPGTSPSPKRTSRPWCGGCSSPTRARPRLRST